MHFQPALCSPSVLEKAVHSTKYAKSLHHSTVSLYFPVSGTATHFAMSPPALLVSYETERHLFSESRLLNSRRAQSFIPLILCRSAHLPILRRLPPLPNLHLRISEIPIKILNRFFKLRLP